MNYRQLPRKGYVVGNSSASGGKIAKERLTVMVCVSMAGEKRKLQVIGQSQRPRGFPRNMSDLPVDYDFSKNAWQTSLTMTKWLKSWDRELRTNNRKILLLMDNARVHPKAEDLELTNIRIHFMPPNTTSLIQPCDAGIINSFKCHFKDQLIHG